MFTPKTDSDRYKVRISQKNAADLTTPETKWTRRVKGFGAMLRKAFTTFLTSLLIMLALICGATPASALEMPDPVGSIGDAMADVIQQKFCSRPFSPEGTVGTGWMPSTAKGLDPEKTKLTFTEKYGMAVPSPTTWEGPRTQQEMDDEGTYAGSVLVRLAGGEGSGLETWGDADNKNDKEMTAQEGFFDTSGGCSPFWDNVNSGLAGGMLQFASLLTYVANEIYTVALNSHGYINDTLGTTILTIVSLLKGAVFLEFLTPIIMVSALWMAWIGLVKRQSTQMAQGLIWMIGASVTSVALMTNPMWLPNLLNDGTNVVSNVVMKKTSEVATEIGGSKSNYCTTDGDSPTHIIRENSCTMAFSFTYVPWVEAQFGQSPNAEDTAKVGTGSYEGGNNGIGKDIVTPPRVLLGNTAAEPQTWALHHFDSRVDYEGAREDVQDRVFITVAANQLYKDDYNKDWKGEKSLDRVSDATLGLAGSIAYLINMLANAFPIIIMDFGIMILVLISPIFFLIGVHPGFGRRIALGWVETVLGLAVKIAVLKVYLALISLLLTTVVSSASDSAGTLHSLICIIAITYASVTYKGQILGMFGKVNLGSGGKTLQGQNEIGKGEGALGGGSAALMNVAKDKAFNGIRNKIADKKLAERRVDSHSASSQLPRPKEDAKDSGPATSDTSSRTPGSDSSASSDDAGGSRKSGPFNPDEHASENQKTDGAGGRPTTSESDSSPEDPKSDGAGTRPKDEYIPENSSYDDSPATRSDRKEQIKFEAQRIKDERLRSGVSSPSILAATVKGAAAGYRSGSASGGLAAGAAVAQNETQRVMSENEARRRAEEAQYEADKRKAERSTPRSGALPPLNTPAPKKDAPTDSPKRDSGGKPEGPKRESPPKGPGAGGRPA